MTVLEHCRIVGAVASALLRRLPESLRRLLPGGAVTVAALHDLGKVSPGFHRAHFVDYLKQVCPGLAETAVEGFETKHAVISEASLKSWFQEHGANEHVCTWAEVLGAHHGKHDDFPARDDIAQYGGPSWRRERHALLGMLLDEFGPLPTSPPTPEGLMLAAGLTCVADWIGSDERWFPASGLPWEADLGALAERALDETGWVWPTVHPGLSFADLFGEEYQPHDMQRVVYDTAVQPGLHVVEAPTGFGKTEAALWAAYRLLESGQNHGVYFALPTRLTSNGIHTRINRFLQRAFRGDARARLLHSQAWLHLPETRGEELRPGGSWFAPSKRGLLLPFGVGTIDQALLGVMQVRHNFMRAFGLAGKVVILDEVHSYDMYTGTLLDELAKLLLRLGCSVFILSATLTKARRQEFFGDGTNVGDSNYPLITYRQDQHQPVPVAAEAPPSRTVMIRRTDESQAALAEGVAERARQGQGVLWIMNTVGAAQSCYKAVKSCVRQGDGPVGLLHSRFPVWRREELEEEWMARLGKEARRETGSVLVATQVVEQSVDIDADLLVSQLAPTDMLLQRLGRLWRHERPQRPAEAPELWLVMDDLSRAANKSELMDRLGDSCWIYMPYVLWRSFRVWQDRSMVSLPEGVRELLEATYRDPADDDPVWVSELFEDFQRHKKDLRGKAIAMTDVGLPALSDREDTRTRYDTLPSLSILLVRGADVVGNRAELTLSDRAGVTAQTGRRDFGVARAIHRNLVSLRPGRRVPRLQSPSWLRQHAHEAGGVLLVGGEGRLRTLDGNITELGYDDSLGVHVLPQDAQQEEEETTYDEFDW